MPHVTANGIQLYYEEHGRGDPLLLLAPTGWPGSVWDLEQVPTLSRHFRVLTLDLRGVGLSDIPDEDYSTELFARDLMAFLRAVDAAPAHILGFSIGGRIAQYIALEAPELIQSLVLAGADAGRTGGRGGFSFEVVLSLAEHGYDGFFLDHLNHPFPFTDEFRTTQQHKVKALADTINARRPPARSYLRHILARVGHNVGERVREIRVPTLVMVGAEDTEARGGGNHVEHAKALAAAIPGAELVEVPGARHLFPWERPAETNQLLLAFFQKHARQPAVTA